LGGRITVEIVDEEIGWMRRLWSQSAASNEQKTSCKKSSVRKAPRALDLFDRVQLASVVKIASRSRTLSEPGRFLFASSREKKNSSNNADHLRVARPVESDVRNAPRALIEAAGLNRVERARRPFAYALAPAISSPLALSLRFNKKLRQLSSHAREGWFNLGLARRSLMRDED
jgi:hypothetical protein